MIQVVPATAELMAPFEKPHGRSFRAVAALQDGAAFGIGGFYVTSNGLVIFMEIDPEIRKQGLSFAHRRAILEGFRMLQDMVGHNLPVRALADENIDGAEVLLEHLGFEHLSDGVWQWQQHQS